jgi:hypothetical protein
MINAGVVFPLTTLGMMLASAMRSLSAPSRRSCGSTTLPIRQVYVMVHSDGKMEREIFGKRVAPYWCPCFRASVGGTYSGPSE